MLGTIVSRINKVCSKLYSAPPIPQKLNIYAKDMPQRMNIHTQRVVLYNSKFLQDCYHVIVVYYYTRISLKDQSNRWIVKLWCYSECCHSRWTSTLTKNCWQIWSHDLHPSVERRKASKCRSCGVRSWRQSWVVSVQARRVERYWTRLQNEQLYAHTTI